MESTYTIPETRREEVTKLLTRYAKKASAYGQSLLFSFGEPYAKEIPVYTSTMSANIWDCNQAKAETQLVEVFDIAIVGRAICKGCYTVVAKIEHWQAGNIVSFIGGNPQGNPNWRTLVPYCDHCNGEHWHKITFIVRDAQGKEDQVGSTCLEDYCGIDPQRVDILISLENIFLDFEIIAFDFENPSASIACKIVDALALASRVQKEYGYTASSAGGRSNKALLTALISGKEKPTDAEIAEAENLASGILALDVDPESEDNVIFDDVITLIKNGYCTPSHFGYIAYVPFGRERILKKAKEKEAEAKPSYYVGNVGERLVIEVAEQNLITSWENAYGRTYLYKIIDMLGNTFVWFASKAMQSTAKKLKATVKDHTERDGIKQTIVTRCTPVTM